MKTLHVQGPLIDRYGRKITYLRVSLTNSCNFRCVYCVPAGGIPSLSREEELSRREIVRFIDIISRLGISRVRLTGGEPLLRADIVDIVRDIKALGRIRDLSVTTNGSLLDKFIAPLKEAGLDRLNVSLDSLAPLRFQVITGSKLCARIRAHVHLALEAGFPVKLNMVVLKGLSEQEITEYVKLAVDYPLEVRFLEFMPLCGEGWRPDLFVPIDDVRKKVRMHFDLAPSASDGERVAETYTLRNGRGRVGFIASLTESFCERCSRIRLTADGKIFPCLFSNEEISVGALLKAGAPDEEIVRCIREAIFRKPRGSHYLDAPYEASKRSHPVAAVPYIRNLGG